jgi:hypothetical protein
MAMCLLTHPKCGPVSVERFRRRDAGGGGRDDRAPEELAHDWGASPAHGFRVAIRLRLCYTQIMSDTLTVRVPGREKDVWQKVARGVGEDLSEFARKAVRQRVQAVQAEHGSPWDDLLGSVSTDAPPALNANVRKAMGSKRW